MLLSRIAEIWSGFKDHPSTSSHLALPDISKTREEVAQVINTCALNVLLVIPGLFSG